jgi:hypothetical protein
MADVLEVFDELTATTQRHRQKTVTDNVTQHNLLLRKMKERGNVTIYGGSDIVEPLGLVENSTITNIAGFQTAATNYDNNVTACRVPWVSKWMAVTCPGDLLRKNMGADAIVKLVDSKIDIAEGSAANYMNAEMYSDGSTDQSIYGLQLWVTTAGTGTAGGTSASIYSNWANQQKTFAAAAFSDTTGLTMRSDFNAQWIKQVFNMEMPDLIVTTNDAYNVYEASIQQQIRYMDKQSADGAIETVMYKSAPVWFDVNANFASTGQKVYLLNTKHIYMFEHPQARWKKEEKRKPVNADGIVIPFIWMGNMMFKSRRTQGIIHA